MEALAAMMECYNSITDGVRVFNLQLASRLTYPEFALTSSEPAAPATSDERPSDEPSPDALAAAQKYSTLLASMEAVMSTKEGTHPLLPVVAAESYNPRLAVIKRYRAIIKLDSKKGCCPTCLANPDLSPAEQEKDHGAHLTAHAASCEMKNNPGKWRCPICTAVIPFPPRRSAGYAKEHPEEELPRPTLRSVKFVVDDEMDEEEMRWHQDEFDAHCAACIEAVMVQVVGAEEDEDEDTDRYGLFWKRL
jgi:hypothetical protein